MVYFRASIFLPSLALISLLAAALFLLMGWDYPIQLKIEANDTQYWNNIWRTISLFGLGKIQAAGCFIALYFYIGRQYPFFSFWKLVFKSTLLTYLRLWRNRAQPISEMKNWPKPAQALFSAVPIMFVVGTICAVLKISIGRPRPKMLLWHNETAFHWLDGTLGRYQSMPSGHVMTTFALLTVLWPHFPKLRWPLLAYGILSAVARVMAMTTHYVSDVLVGAALGIALALIFNRQLSRIPS